MRFQKVYKMSGLRSKTDVRNLNSAGYHASLFGHEHWPLRPFANFRTDALANAFPLGGALRCGVARPTFRLSPAAHLHGFCPTGMEGRVAGYRRLPECKAPDPFLGFQEPISRSTLADENEQRDWRLCAGESGSDVGEKPQSAIPGPSNKKAALSTGQPSPQRARPFGICPTGESRLDPPRVGQLQAVPQAYGTVGGFLAGSVADSRQKRRHQEFRSTGENASLKCPCGMAFSEISGMTIDELLP